MADKGEALMPELSTLLTGLVFGESPRWHEGKLWFCDWGAHEIVAVDLAGKRETVTKVPQFPFSIDWLPDGTLLIISSRLQRMASDGSTTSHGDLSELGGPWNELVVGGGGNAYINAPGFDLMAGAPPTSGTIALVTPDGRARQVADDVWFPNGMAITDDESTLIVAESYRNRLTAFDIEPNGDGGLTNRRTWADLGTGVPDGICVDREGAIWYADVPNRQCVRVGEGGETLQTVNVDRGCFSCALGGPDGDTLFIVATEWRGPQNMFQGQTGQILTVDVDVPRAGHL
jgi:sugar lactone lactonase YvrE